MLYAVTAHTWCPEPDASNRTHVTVANPEGGDAGGVEADLAATGGLSPAFPVVVIPVGYAAEMVSAVCMGFAGADLSGELRRMSSHP